jgi:hypothetical protein
MGNVTGMKFEPRYIKLDRSMLIGLSDRKVYFAGLHRLKVTRWSRRRGFRTATEALVYARRWGKRAEGMIKVSTEATR